MKLKTYLVTDANTAIRAIKRGKRIFIGSGCAEPQHLVEALARNHSRFSDNEIVHLLTIGIAPYTNPEYQSSFRHNAFFIGSNVRKAISEGLGDYTPIFLSEIPTLFNTGQMPIHCSIVQVSPPDINNEVSLGISVDIELSAILNSEIVIAQVNKFMPVTRGNSKISVNKFDFLVNFDEPLLQLPADVELDEVSLNIGKNISRFIKDGDTLQMGIGKIPDAVLKNLTDKHELGIHTEMFSDGIIELYKNGNITNSRKGFHEKVTITSFAMGSNELYDLIDNNPDFEFYPSEYVNDPNNISKNKNMISINSALQVDLTGQVCADSLGTLFFSGIGGQVDFVRGARRSQGGKSFIALPSTAKNGTISRIVPTLDAGAGVVTSRGDVEYVVTEFGIAFLHGKTIRERGLALIQIAHPRFREQLLDYLKQLHYVFIDQKTIKNDNNLIRDLIPFNKTFKDKTIYFRTLQPSDEKVLQDFFYNQDPEIIYQSCHDYNKTFSHQEVQSYVVVDYSKDMVIAGFNSPAPYAKMVCIGRYISNENNTVDLGLVIQENFQRIGLGTFLLEILLKACEKIGIEKMLGYVSYTNIPMLCLFEKYGFIREYNQDSELLLFAKIIAK